jgi:MFS family permease
MPLGSYFQFAARNRRFLAFGFLMAFSSSFGQTYFVGVFGPAIQTEFALSHTLWGTVYMLGTLGSALLLPWSGKQIDRLDLRHYTAIVSLLLIVACGYMSQVSGTITLVIGIFLLRQAGQGLASHVAITSMVRYFDAGRGRAVAIASLGFAIGEAFLPFVAVLAIAAIGWRWSYAGIVLLLILTLVPSAFALLKGHGRRHREHLAHLANASATTTSVVRSWTRAEVLRDTRFYLLLPGILAPSIIVTAMFFHHLNLADSKGWSHTWMTGSYAIYAAATVFTSLASGSIIDRIGAVRLVPFMLAPLALAMLVVVGFASPWAVWPYLVLLGLNAGIAHTAVATLWAELYGVAHLGAIKSLAAALSVFGSALGPVILGGLMDLGVSMGQGCLIFATYTALGAVLMVLALRRAQGEPAEEACSGRRS